MTKQDMIDHAEAILGNADLLVRKDGSPTRARKKMKRHLTFVLNGTGDTKYHQKKLVQVVKNTVDFYEITVK